MRDVDKELHLHKPIGWNQYMLQRNYGFTKPHSRDIDGQ